MNIAIEFTNMHLYFIIILTWVVLFDRLTEEHTLM